MTEPAPVAAAWSGSRRLLRLLRDIMRTPASPQERLDRIVRLIAQDMVAEVCSLYILRGGETLELFATCGLRPEAVHRTRMRVGEGLVGLIAGEGRTLAIAEAQEHPNFAYFPETGEEVYHSLMGTPLQRGGRPLGVLVVQNVNPRDYGEEEGETLETVAMVLAELVAGGSLIENLLTDSRLPARLTGQPMSSGIAVGTAVIHGRGIRITQIVSDDPEREQARLEAAMQELHDSIDLMLASADLPRKHEGREILDTYRLVARDQGWQARILEAILGGLSAEAAVERVKTDTRARMSRVADPYLRQRLADLEALADRLLQTLTAGEGASTARELPDRAVLIARTLGPADLLEFDRDRLRGVVLEEGAPGAHVGIVARALDLPMLGGCTDAHSELRDGDTVVVDADSGQLLIRPNEPVLQAFETRDLESEQRRARQARNRELPSVTRDGVAVELSINAGLLIDLPQVEETGAAGIGLYRTEVPFMVRSAYPDAAAQAELYARVFDQVGGRPVVFRTLDAGGDKPLPYWPSVPEENPAMGWRALRIGLDRPGLLREQLRALIEAAAGRALAVMFPMVSQVAEFDTARSVLEREIARAASRGRPVPARLDVGVMLEVPSLLWQLPRLLERVDFLAVGSNDLLQFLFASDRSNPRLQHRFDPLSPPALKVLSEIAGRAAEAGKPVSLCGEMAGRPLEAMALIGCGFRKLSMPPRSVDGVRTMVRSLELGPLAEFVARYRDSPVESLRSRLAAFACDHGVEL